MDGILTAINDFFRGILWAIVDVFLFILDCVWQIVLRIATLDVSANQDIQNWYLLIVCFLTLFLIFRICKISVKFYFDDEYREKISVSKILVRLVLCSFLVGFIPIAYKGVCYVSTDAIKNISTFIPLESEDLSMSNILIQSGRVDIQNPTQDLTNEIERNDDFDINKKDTEDNYMYFPDYANIFMMIIVSIVAVFIFVMTALQIAQRFYMILFKYLLAPYVIASIIDPEDNSFGVWLKMIGGDLIMNFAQIYGTYFLMFICNNSAIQKMLGDDWVALFARIVLFIGGLLALQELPSTIAGITGGAGRGIMQSLQDLKGMATTSKAMSFGAAGAIAGAVGTGIAGAGLITHGVQSGGSVAKEKFSSAKESGASPLKAGMMAAGAVAGAGIKTGVKSATQPMAKKVSGIFNGGLGKYASEKKGGFGITSGGSSNGHSDNPNFDLPPTGKQIFAAEQLGIEEPDQYSRGQLSMLMQDAGADTSFWNDSDKGQTFISGHNSQDLAAAKYYGIEEPEKMSDKQLQGALKEKGHKVASTSSKKAEPVSLRANDMYNVNLDKTKGKN